MLIDSEKLKEELIEEDNDLHLTTGYSIGLKSVLEIINRQVKASTNNPHDYRCCAGISKAQYQFWITRKDHKYLRKEDFYYIAWVLDAYLNGNNQSEIVRQGEEPVDVDTPIITWKKIKSEGQNV